MLEAIGVLLALVGFLALVVGGAIALAVWLDGLAIELRSAADSDPTEESLAAAGRLSAAGFEAERLMHTLAEQVRREEDIQ